MTKRLKKIKVFKPNKLLITQKNNASFSYKSIFNHNGSVTQITKGIDDIFIWQNLMVHKDDGIDELKTKN